MIQYPKIQKLARRMMRGVQQGDEGIEFAAYDTHTRLVSAFVVRNAQIKRLSRENRELRKLLSRVGHAALRLCEEADEQTGEVDLPLLRRLNKVLDTFERSPYGRR